FDRDSESQAIFEKNNFYTIGGKIITVSISTHLKILNKVVESNKCLLKISLVRISQEVPYKIKDAFVVNVMIYDYASHKCSFIMKVVFLSHDLCLAHLKNKIHFQESLIFVVGQMEIFANEFYVYAKDINYVDTDFIVKNKGLENNLPSNPIVTQSNLKNKSENNNSASVNLHNFEDKSESSSDDAKYIGREFCDMENVSAGDEFHKDNFCELVKKRKILFKKGKKCADRSLHSSLRPFRSNIGDSNRNV
ncbi:19583_t:CDS:2, partial [Dentiscutata erythropus]